MRVDLTGDRYGRLTVIEHIGYTKRRQTIWRCECSCGAIVTVTGTNMRHGKTRSCGCLRSELMSARMRAKNPRLSEGVISYNGAHLRVSRERGRASTHPCVDCGDTAGDWSYDGLDPDHLRDQRGRAYSLLGEHYQPRCRTCHIRFDRNVPVTP